tara:strand:+ start:1726 stop:1968 length:243 start_codon:yes stop_codon:yes gene_type:complete
MPRTCNSENNYYHYEVVLGEERKYIRTLKLVAKYLELGTATIIRKLKNPNITLRKYKDINLQIIKCKVPIYSHTRETILY